MLGVSVENLVLRLRRIREILHNLKNIGIHPTLLDTLLDQESQHPLQLGILSLHLSIDPLWVLGVQMVGQPKG